jgi:anti-sigma regulatory factor (Ser/Thr protein kinase)
MSTTRPYPAGDHGPEPGAPSTAPGHDPDPPAETECEPTPAPAPDTEPLRQVRRLRLVDIQGAVSRARDFTRRALHDWGWLPAATTEQWAAAEDVLLVVSELVTNACLHAGGPEELRIGHAAKLLRVEVTDAGTGTPALRPSRRAGRPGGHGMFIVQRLCLDWGVIREAGTAGKTVWAELAAPSVS